MWEYWVDTKTFGTFKATEKEEIIDSTSVEGRAENFVLGLEAGQPADPNGELSGDEDDEDDGSESDPEAASTKGKGKGSRKAARAEVQEERAFEACMFRVYRIKWAYVGFMWGIQRFIKCLFMIYIYMFFTHIRPM